MTVGRQVAAVVSDPGQAADQWRQGQVHHTRFTAGRLQARGSAQRGRLRFRLRSGRLAASAILGTPSWHDLGIAAPPGWRRSREAAKRSPAAPCRRGFWRCSAGWAACNQAVAFFSAGCGGGAGDGLPPSLCRVSECQRSACGSGTSCACDRRDLMLLAAVFWCSIAEARQLTAFAWSFMEAALALLVGGEGRGRYPVALGGSRGRGGTRFQQCSWPRLL